MPYNATAPLWPSQNEAFFRTKCFRPVRQQGPHCVSTVLAMLTGEAPESFQGAVNTQDPISWSEALREWGMKLAYCPTDARKLKHNMDELVRLDDLFTVSFYTSPDPRVILGEPDGRGWITGSHIVILHRRTILDPATGAIADALKHECNDRYTKRVFRVVPADSVRGL